jgi:ABC-type transport system substrate-binding protein
MAIDERETAVRNTLIAENKHDACMAAHVNLVSADNNLRLLFYTGSLNNRMKYSNPELDAKMDAALVEQDEAKRIQMYKEMQQFVVDEALCIPLYVEPMNVAMNKDLEGVKLVATGCHDFIGNIPDGRHMP